MIVVNELGRVVKSTVLVQEDILQLDAPMRVNPTGVADTNVLAYNSASSTWLPSAAGSGTVGGSGTSPKIPKWTAGSTLGDSILSETTSGLTITLTQGVATSGSPNVLIVAGGVHTTLTASEAIDIKFNLDRIVQFSTGNRSFQRAILIGAPTYAFVGPTTIGDAATFVIGDAPVPGTNATLTRSHALWVQSGMTTLAGGLNVGSALTATGVGWVRITQGISSSGSPNLMVVGGGAHVTLAASVEAIDINFNLARTVQFAQGALATQRAVVFQAPTYAFATGASTLTTAATVAITDAPAAGTNATLTASLAFWVQVGRVLFGSGELATNSIDGLQLRQVVTATASRAIAYGLTLYPVLTAAANGNTLQVLFANPVIATAGFTGLLVRAAQFGVGSVTGGGTMSQVAIVGITETTNGTANVGLLIGTHPGGSTNYSMYINSSNALFLGSGAWRIDGQHSTGANTATFAATNKPGSAVTLTPQTWLKINLGGTDYYIPCWI